MPRKRVSKSGQFEYRFVIDAYTPATMPMARLAEYMRELAQIMGEPDAVHFRRLQRGSTAVVSRVEREAVPKVRERVSAVRRGEGPKEAREGYRTINRLLRADNGVGYLQETKTRATVIKFPGRDEVPEEFTAVRQHGSIDGIVTGIRGKDQTIHFTLLSEGQQLSGIYTKNAALAKQLAAKFREPVRLFGRGRWARDAEGNWTLIDFKVESFDSLLDIPLSAALAEMRSIPTEWGDEAYGDLKMIRHGPKDKRNGGH
jgi:hypothetical protein